MPAKKQDPVKRLFSHADVRGDNECWFWQAAIGTATGYGVAWLNGQVLNAHRAVWIALFGPIEDGLVVCHSCDNPTCVNPKHLWLGTQAQNLEDCRNKNRQTYQFGSAHHRSAAKITEECVRRIREARLFGAKMSDLASAYGLDKSVISRICNRKSWRHIA